MRIVIYDIDGTLACTKHRNHFIKPNPPIDARGKKVPRRFDLFHKACVDDTPIPAVVHSYLRDVADPDTLVFLLTGRPMSARYDTEQWFAKHGLGGYDELYTKPAGWDFRPDVEVKEHIANEIEKQWNHKIDAVYEDRSRVVAMWKRRGTFVFNVLQEDDQ